MGWEVMTSGSGETGHNLMDSLNAHSVMWKPGDKETGSTLSICNSPGAR